MVDEKTIQSELEESARPGFNDKDVGNLRILVKIIFEFHEFWTSDQSRVSQNAFDDLLYTSDKVLINIDSFRSVLRSYGILRGAMRSRIDWSELEVHSAKETFLSLFPQFLAKAGFESKCRLLLDLFKLLIVFVGANYDCPA
jgi:hypothetical protein